MLRRRRKRAAADDLYRSCIRTGNCPTDVKNKIENNTLADRILKWASGVIYLGGLGIGTSSSGSGVRIGGPAAGSFRPTLPVDAIGPNDIAFDAGLVRPTDSAVVEPTDVHPGFENVIPDADLPREEIPLLPMPPRVGEDIPRVPIAVEDPIAPDVTISEGGEFDRNSSVVPQPPRGPQTPHVVSRSQYTNPAFEVSVHTDTTAGEFSTSDSIIIHGGGGEHIGENIPMVEFLRPEPTGRLEEETEFTTSTPDAPPRGRRPALTNRRWYEQVQVADPAFLSRPATLVTFENPAFEDDVTLQFEMDVDEVLQAPDPDFRGVVRLGRPEYSRLGSGRLRVSRLGQKANMKTRSGAVLGAQTHFYQDLSSITEGESIPLTVFGETSGESSFAQPLNETGFTNGSRPILVDPDLEVVFIEDSSHPVPDETLLDEYEDVSSNARLIMTTDTDLMQSRTSIVPEMLRPPFIFPEAGGGGVHIVFPQGDHGNPAIIPEFHPDIVLDLDSFDYYLHPSLTRKKRRRRKQIFVY
uniref:Minor capsid protein L2 n=1 Tax=Rhinolophus ferrumequinum papillomavirus 2 TaxID=3140014 RepID=A0AAU6S4W5_9PAPI